MADVGVAVVWQEHFVRGGGTRGVSGQGVWCLVPDAWYMNHAKPISEGLLLDIAEAGIADLVDRAVPISLLHPSTKWRALSRASATARASPSIGAYLDSAACVNGTQPA